jgi:predicted dehydrogenase
MKTKMKHGGTETPKAEKKVRQLRIGHIGWLSLDEGPECTTVAWCDINSQKIEELGRKHPNIAMFTDYREMLRKADLDLVVIASPNFAHADQAVAFLDAGSHVFLEKPMGINRDECDRIIGAQRRSGKNLGIDFEIRVSPCAQRLKSLIDGGEYGQLRRIEYLHHQGAWLESGNGVWRTKPGKSGGMLLECPIHYIDIFRFFAGEIESVQSTVGPNVLPHYKFEDNICSHFFFANGVLATMLNTHTHSAIPIHEKQWKDTAEYMWSMGHDMTMIFTLTGGSIAVDFLTPAIMINRFEEWPTGSGAVRVIHERTENFRNAGYGFYHDSEKMRWDFIHRCAAGRPPVQDPLDAWRSHIVCLAAEQSAQEDFRRVKVDYTLPRGMTNNNT